MGVELGRTSAGAAFVERAAAARAGKWRRLWRLADDDGRFAMIAVDQRMSLKAMLNGDVSESEACSQLESVKRVVTREIGPLATAVLTDPIYGFPQTQDVLPSGTGLVLAVEASGYVAAGQDERRTRLLDGFSAQAAATAGADAAKLLIWHHPDASDETKAHQNDIVRRVGADCHACGMPFILEIVTYGLGEKRSSSEFIRRKPELVLDGVRTYSSEDYMVDLFKVQFPADLKYTEGYEQEPYATGSVLFEKDEVSSLCAELDRVASAPWVVLSAGVDPDEFIENVKIANAAGASGFLCGRAVWKNVVPLLPDDEAMGRFMRTNGCEHFRRIRNANDGARPWVDHANMIT